MYTQNTPVHIHLWNHDFWRLMVASLLLSMSAYMYLVLLPDTFDAAGAVSGPCQTAWMMAAFGIGIVLTGPFCSYLVQHYRRNVVCMLAVVGMTLGEVFIYWMASVEPDRCLTEMLFLPRLLQGACYGLAQMTLMSTLIIDTCESFQRTEANYSSTWFSRFALALGPFAALIAMKSGAGNELLLVPVACSLLSVLLIRMVKFPFKAPEDVLKVVSLDRFFLPQGIFLFLNMLLVTIVVGLILAEPQSPLFYGMLMTGFFAALLSQRFIFANAELKSEIVAGLLLMFVALLLLLTRRQPIVQYVSPLFIGQGLGIVTSRFLLFFIKLSRHCQRGTSQSTYFLAWELGLVTGLSIGHALLIGHHQLMLVVSMALTVGALMMYVLFTHSWYLVHRNR